MAAQRHEPIPVDGLELRASGDGESYIVYALAGGASLPIGDIKAGNVDMQLDDALRRHQEEAAAAQTAIAPEPGTVSRTEPESAPPGAPGTEPAPEQPQQP